MEQGRGRIRAMSGGMTIIAGLILTGCGGGADPASSQVVADPLESEAGETDAPETEAADIDDVVAAAERAIDDVEDAAAGGGGQGGTVTVDGESYDQALAITCSVLGINVSGLTPDTVPYLLAIVPEDVAPFALDLSDFGGEPGGAQLIFYPFQDSEELVGTAGSFELDGAAPATVPEAGVSFEATGSLDGVGDFQVRGTC